MRFGKKIRVVVPVGDLNEGDCFTKLGGSVVHRVLSKREFVVHGESGSPPTVIKVADCVFVGKWDDPLRLTAMSETIMVMFETTVDELVERCEAEETK